MQVNLAYLLAKIGKQQLNSLKTLSKSSLILKKNRANTEKVILLMCNFLYITSSVVTYYLSLLTEWKASQGLQL